MSASDSMLYYGDCTFAMLSRPIRLFCYPTLLNFGKAVDEGWVKVYY